MTRVLPLLRMSSVLVLEEEHRQYNRSYNLKPITYYFQICSRIFKIKVLSVTKIRPCYTLRESETLERQKNMSVLKITERKEKNNSFIEVNSPEVCPKLLPGLPVSSS